MRRLLVDHGNALADVPALCAEVRALREVAEAAREVLHQTSKDARFWEHGDLEVALAKLGAR